MIGENRIGMPDDKNKWIKCGICGIVQIAVFKRRLYINVES